MTDLPRTILMLQERIAEIERRIDGSVRVGRVQSVDPAAGTVVVEIAPGHLSPPVFYAQQMGALAIHAPPSVGQMMVLHSPSGDIRSAIAMPYAAGGGNASPGSSGDTNVLTFGSVRVSLSGSVLTIQIGGCTITISAAGINVSSGDVKADGISLKMHVHDGIQRGNSDTAPPK